MDLNKIVVEMCMGIVEIVDFYVKLLCLIKDVVKSELEVVCVIEIVNKVFKVGGVVILE